MKKKILFFDFDGVIVDSLESAAQIHTEILKNFGKELIVTPELIRTNWKGVWQNLYLQVYGLTKEELLLTAPLYKELARANSHKAHVYKDMDFVIKNLAKTHTLLVVSANYSDIIYNALEEAKLDTCFSGIYGQDQLGEIEKSDPRFFLTPIDELNIEREDVVVIGDTEGEVIGARKAGLVSIACSWGWQDRDSLVEAKPDYLADDPRELLSIIREI